MRPFPVIYPLKKNDLFFPFFYNLTYHSQLWEVLSIMAKYLLFYDTLIKFVTGPHFDPLISYKNYRFSHVIIPFRKVETRRGSKGSQHSQLTTYKKYRKSYTTSFAYFLFPSSCVFWSRCGSRCHHCASQTRCFFNIFRFSADMKSREYYYLGWNLPSS